VFDLREAASSQRCATVNMIILLIILSTLIPQIGGLSNERTQNISAIAK
jgi:hypothetical protein